MNRTLAIAVLIGSGVGIAGMIFDTGTTVDLAAGLYVIAGLLFYTAGTWLAIRVLRGK